MITFPALGNIGRLGNQLFQMASTIALAASNGEAYGFPRWQYEGRFLIRDCFHDRLPEGPDYHQQRYAYEPIPYSQNLRLHGFFQSEKYFSGHKELIRSLLTPSQAPLRENYKDAASLHVRRGDYVGIPEHFPPLGQDYYGKAMEILLDRGVSRFLVFSDDFGWCQEHFNGSLIEIVPPMSDIEHLSLMIACAHHITANSTFSWWGAWLNPDPSKVVIAPKQWYGKAYESNPNPDILPASWIAL